MFGLLKDVHSNTVFRLIRKIPSFFAFLLPTTVSQNSRVRSRRRPFVKSEGTRQRRATVYASRALDTVKLSMMTVIMSDRSQTSTKTPEHLEQANKKKFKIIIMMHHAYQCHAFNQYCSIYSYYIGI